MDRRVGGKSVYRWACENGTLAGAFGAKLPLSLSPPFQLLPSTLCCSSHPRVVTAALFRRGFSLFNKNRLVELSAVALWEIGATCWLRRLELRSSLKKIVLANMYAKKVGRACSRWNLVGGRGGENFAKIVWDREFSLFIRRTAQLFVLVRLGKGGAFPEFSVPNVHFAHFPELLKSKEFLGSRFYSILQTCCFIY